MSKVEIILVEIVPISALYYKIHTISILQVRKLVVQVTSTSTSTSTSRKTCNTSYKYKYKYKLQELKNRPLLVKKTAHRQKTGERRVINNKLQSNEYFVREPGGWLWLAFLRCEFEMV